MRVLYLIHGHDQFSVGGAENAAFSLFRELQQHTEIETDLGSRSQQQGVLAHGQLRSGQHGSGVFNRYQLRLVSLLQSYPQN